jgi:streptogrisin C
MNKGTAGSLVALTVTSLISFVVITDRADARPKKQKVASKPKEKVSSKPKLDTTAGVQTSPEVATTSISRYVDGLAKSVSVSPDTARIVIAASPQISSLAETLEKAEGFGGLWLDWAAVPPVVNVAFTGQATADTRALVQGRTAVGIRFQTVASTRSLKELRAEQDAILRLLTASGVRTGIGISVRTARNTVEVEVPKSDTAALETVRLLVSSAGVSASVVPVDGPGDRLATVMFGGGLLTDCTSGFTASFGGARGMFTAGHCSDAQSQVGVNMPVVPGTDSCAIGSLQIADRQVNEIPYPNTATNEINISISPYTRTITSAISASGYYDGQPLERDGKTNNYQTGTVETSDYANTTCGGLSHLVRATALTAGGDSGGPWFSGSQAFGVTNAYSINSWGVFSRIAYVESGTGYVTCTIANCP